MGKKLTKEEWLKRRLIKKKLMLLSAAILMIAILAFSILVVVKLVSVTSRKDRSSLETVEVSLSNGSVVREWYLTPNPYSRPQHPLKKVKGIVIHYTANPNTSAENNRNYFEGLAEKKDTAASSHYIIGLEGEVIQCIPLTEIAYASNDRNIDTISIECCHEDETGKFNDKTYASLVELSAALCREFNLKREDIIRHYDVTGKLCPLYYVEHEEDWEKLRDDIIKKTD
jgi:N-acetylmuramoyl-L-alanine amidase